MMIVLNCCALQRSIAVGLPTSPGGSATSISFRSPSAGRNGTAEPGGAGTSVDREGGRVLVGVGVGAARRFPVGAGELGVEFLEARRGSSRRSPGFRLPRPQRLGAAAFDLDPVDQRSARRWRDRDEIYQQHLLPG